MSAVDVHTHLAPAGSADGRRASAGAPPVRVGPAALYDATALVSYLDGAGLSAAVVSPAPLFSIPDPDPDRSAAAAARINDGLLATIGGNPRLYPLAMLPLDHPAAALQEYRRVRRQPDWVGVELVVGASAIPLSDPSLDDLWALLDSDGAVVLVHPGGNPDPRLADYYLSNLVGGPFETALAAARLIFAGVPARFPGVRLVLAHCGGATLTVIGRIQRAFQTARAGVPTGIEAPIAACRRLWVDSLAFHEGLVALAVDTFGSDKVVLGSDWPFGMRPGDPMELLRACPHELQSRIAESNAQTLLAGAMGGGDMRHRGT